MTCSEVVPEEFPARSEGATAGSCLEVVIFVALAFARNFVVWLRAMGIELLASLNARTRAEERWRERRDGGKSDEVEIESPRQSPMGVAVNGSQTK